MLKAMKIIVYTPAGEIVAKSIIEAQEYKKLYGYFYKVIRDNEPPNSKINSH